MTKVAHIASTSGIAAELEIRTKLKKSKKRGLNNPIRSDRTTRARSGAKALSRSSHLRELSSGFVALACADSGIVLVEILFTSQNFRRKKDSEISPYVGGCAACGARKRSYELELLIVPKRP